MSRLQWNVRNLGSRGFAVGLPHNPPFDSGPGFALRYAYTGKEDDPAYED
jgi:hypothetical protein